LGKGKLTKEGACWRRQCGLSKKGGKGERQREVIPQKGGKKGKRKIPSRGKKRKIKSALASL